MGKKPKVYWQCQRCTNCCKWPGDVIVTQEDVDRIAGFLNLPVDEFISDFTRLSANRRHLSLIDKEGGDECIMLDGRDCRINPVKPAQCSGFPNEWTFPGWRKFCEAVPGNQTHNPISK